ncbi:DNA methyltransferase [Lentzea sp. NPDC102401]|uniref:DNA methyltransferase n=1 Tax=Lentzea sp. NPDC102401 TaxID=3364128 RepID=UPI003827794B
MVTTPAVGLSTQRRSSYPPRARPNCATSTESCYCASPFTADRSGWCRRPNATVPRPRGDGRLPSFGTSVRMLISWCSPVIAPWPNFSTLRRPPMTDGALRWRTSPLSIWPTGQRAPLTQLRDSGCVAGTEADTDLIPPTVAAHAIEAYTRPGDLVLDPDCGSGTVMVEALRNGRHTVGLTTSARWWALARANVTAAKAAGAWHGGWVLDARPKLLTSALAAGLVGQVGLVLASLRATPEHQQIRVRGTDVATDDLATTMQYCEPLLRSGGHLVVVARPSRNPDGSLADLTTPLIAAATAARLAPVERCVALTAEIRGSRLITRASLAERRAARRARAERAPTALTAHLEVLVFQLAHDAELAAAASVPPRAEDDPLRAPANGADRSHGRRAA